VGEAVARSETFERWPVNWSAIWVGALAALAAVLLLGLIAIAIGAHVVDPEHRLVRLSTVQSGAMLFGVIGAFFSFVLAGWIAARIAGASRSEPAMLHGAIAWLLAVPFLAVLAALGVGGYAGSWYAGLAGTPSWVAPNTLPFERPDTSPPLFTQQDRDQYIAERDEYREKVKKWREDSPRAARNSALFSVTALLLGLVGSVIGGWMASGEPMTLTYHRSRPPLTRRL